MKKALFSLLMVSSTIIGFATCDLAVAECGGESDVTICGNVNQVCVAKDGGNCTFNLTKKDYYTHQNNISIHGDVAQLCTAKQDGRCYMGNESHRAKSCIKYQDGYVDCFPR